CHMPTTTYMVIDPRHDHSIRIPRPEQSVKLGTPNACTNCHTDKSAQWAAEQTRKWYPHPIAGYQQFAEALHAGSTGAPGALDQLVAVAENKDQPGIARASAVARMSRYLNQRAVDGIRLLLYDNDPLVRRAAVEALDNAGTALRAQLLPGLLDDPVKSVRIEAARSLVAAERLHPAQRGRLAAVLDEYVTVQMFNADRPESHSNLGTLYAEQGEFQKAEASFKTALELSPYFVAASVNLADVYRAQGRERDAETILRQALRTSPLSPDVHHALGLSLVRQHRMADALAELRKAATLGPQTARYRYVYAVALYGAGQRIKAIKELESALKQHPYDREILVALVSYLRESGEGKQASVYASRLAELEPGIQQTAH
ncbi:MAG: tetratricopeptide repeat protein, partial [Burkholderiales bacterium]